MKEHMMAIGKKAKESLERDKHLMPAGFLFKGKDLLLVVGTPYKDNEEKRLSMLSLGALGKQKGATNIMAITDACMRSVSKEDEEYVRANYDTEGPTAYPESMRKECILLNNIDIVSGKDSLLVIEYKNNDGKFEFKEPSFVEGGGGFMKTCILNGYNQKIGG